MNENCSLPFERAGVENAPNAVRGPLWMGILKSGRVAAIAALIFIIIAQMMVPRTLQF